jgi:hypothetical protein
MKIEKNIDEVGGWFCTWRDKSGHYHVVAKSGKVEDAIQTKLTALDAMFKKLEWGEIGNWKRNEQTN